MERWGVMRKALRRYGQRSTIANRYRPVAILMLYMLPSLMRVLLQASHGSFFDFLLLELTVMSPFVAPAVYTRYERRAYLQAEYAGTPADYDAVSALLERVRLQALERFVGMNAREIQDYIEQDLRDNKHVEIRWGKTPFVAKKGSIHVEPIDTLDELYIILRRGHVAINAHEYLHILQIEALLKAGLPATLIEDHRGYHDLFEISAYRITIDIGLRSRDGWGVAGGGFNWVMYQIGFGPVMIDIYRLALRAGKSIGARVPRHPARSLHYPMQERAA